MREAAVGTAAQGLAGPATVTLVERARQGDVDAFDLLARASLDRAYRLAAAILRSESDARDAVQDALLAAWQQLPRLRDAARFDAWLDRIVVNACRMQLRHQRVVRVREIGVPDPATPIDREAADPSDDRMAEADLVARALLRLDVSRRALLVLHYAEDRPLAEIAAVLGVPQGTVKWRLHAARAALQRAVEEESR